MPTSPKSPAPQRKPRSQANLWVRRILSSVIILGVLGVISYQVYLLVKGLVTKVDESYSAATQTTTEASQISPCTLESVTLTTQALALDSAWQFDITASTEGSPCSISTSDLQLSLVWLSTEGEVTVWAPTYCDSTWEKTLLLVEGYPWSKQYHWYGAFYSQCTDSDTPLAGYTKGTYQLNLSYQGQIVHTASFVIQ